MTTNTTGDLIRRDVTGRLICAACERGGRFGWVYKFGGVSLVTCGLSGCWPDQRAGWFRGLEFTKHATRKRQ